MKRTLTLFALSSLTAHLHAARPFETDDIGTVAPGTFETELSADAWSDKGAFGLNVKHGLTERMDLGIALEQTSWPRTNRGFEDAELTFKYSLIPELLSASFTSELGTTAYGVNGILSRSFGNLGLDLNLGGDVTGGTQEADLTWGIHPSWTVGPATLGAELRGDQHQADWWQVGTQVKILDGMAVDLGLGDDVKSGHDWHVATGIWFAFPATAK